MKQEKLEIVKLTPAQVEELKIKLANNTIEYIKIEEEKKATDADFADRMKELWAEICGIKAELE